MGNQNGSERDRQKRGNKEIFQHGSESPTTIHGRSRSNTTASNTTNTRKQSESHSVVDGLKISNQTDFSSSNAQKKTKNTKDELGESNSLDGQSKRDRHACPSVFTWSEPGSECVYITGSFNGWSSKIPLVRNLKTNEFTIRLLLPPGTYKYKYIVDGKFEYDNKMPTVPDKKGGISNHIQVLESLNIIDELLKYEGSDTEIEYNQQIPLLSSMTKPPPTLPPHLLKIILNSNPNSENKTSLPVPSHVMLNHLYALSISNGVMVLGETRRYRNKYFTTVIYKAVD